MNTLKYKTTIKDGQLDLPPLNLPENTDSRMIQGAGRALIELLVKYSYNQNGQGVIKLSAYEQSLSFYQELGFIQDSKSNCNLDLILPITEVQKFLK
jgi:hypothetical protein